MLIRLWITINVIRNPLPHWTEKKSQKSLFVDKKGLKTGVIHIFSTKCGYMDSNNVEMWITMGTPIS